MSGRDIKVLNESVATVQYFPFCLKCRHNHPYKEELTSRVCEHPFCLCDERIWSKKEYDQVPHDPNCKCNNSGMKKPRTKHNVGCSLYKRSKAIPCGCALILDDKEIPCNKKASHRWDHAWTKRDVTVYWRGPDHKVAKRRGEPLRKEVSMFTIGEKGI